jgi:hypothetical protein
MRLREEGTTAASREVKGYVLRRSPRAMVKIPVIIKGVDKHGYEFEEETETFVVSKFGARVFTVHELAADAVLELRLKSSDEWSRFRIVWLGRQEDDSLGHVGLEFIQTTNFFGVVFPGEDWT